MWRNTGIFIGWFVIFGGYFGDAATARPFAISVTQAPGWLFCGVWAVSMHLLYMDVIPVYVEPDSRITFGSGFVLPPLVLFRTALDELQLAPQRIVCWGAFGGGSGQEIPRVCHGAPNGCNQVAPTLPRPRRRETNGEFDFLCGSGDQIISCHG
ncbi:hypothetical protein FHX76_002452 [Lysinibacter cavernae]|uniref:Uncharacterized protein n=1 Tax=Lysinibacter cavernae TaxID=1640652 RepID=A0A7X5R2T3_9MICO|nr:hypothetical protein [Lysinibacter cavernae]